jgi:hypothetical protein
MSWSAEKQQAVDSKGKRRLPALERFFLLTSKEGVKFFASPLRSSALLFHALCNKGKIIGKQKTSAAKENLIQEKNS